MGNMCDNFIIYEDNKNEFQIWQGLIGAHFTPHVDELGNLSWTNNGYLPNPETVNVSGRGLTIAGIVATTGDLPETANNYDTYLVGSDEEYFAYLYYNGSWVNLGTVGRGEKGDTGDPATVTSETTVYQQGDSGTTPPSGTWSSTVPTITQGKFLWTKTTLEFNTGDPLVWYAVAYQAVDGQGSPGSNTPLIDSGSGVVGTATAYSREDHQHPLNVATSGTPEMDGTASLGSAATYARTDHVHPLYNQFVRPNLLDNWYFVGGGSQQGGGQFPINQRGQTSYSTVNTYTIDRWKMVAKHTVNLLSTGIKITCDSSSAVNNAFVQELGSLPNNKYTLSVLVVEDTTTNGFHLRYNISTSSKMNGVGLFSWTFTSNSMSSVALQFDNRSADNGNYITVAAMKLELGDTQTLAHQENGTWVLNEIPDYSEQLLKCQRYYWRINSSSGQLFGIGIAHNTTTVRFYPQIAAMRGGAVTITGSGLALVAPNTSISNAISVSSFSGGAHSPDMPFTQMDLVASSLTTGTVYQIYIGNNGYLAVSADL